MAAILLIALVLLQPPQTSAQPSGTGRLTGRVTSPAGDTLPGVTVTLEGAGMLSTAISGGDGHFAIETPVRGSGAYTVTASLPGFETTTRTVRLTPGETATTEIVLALGCAEIDLVIERGVVAEARDADLVAHIRIEAVHPESEWRGEHGCVIASDVEASLLADSRGGPPRRIRMLIPPRTSSRYKPGDELVGAMTRDSRIERFIHWTRGAPVVDGVVTLDDQSVRAGFDRTMPVDRFLDRLR